MLRNNQKKVVTHYITISKFPAHLKDRIPVVWRTIKVNTGKHTCIFYSFLKGHMPFQMKV